jgi:5-methylcytosine-specific restriction protein A
MMPTKPKRLCRQAGCTLLTDDGYCATHKKTFAEKEAIRKKKYDGVKPSWYNWYNTARWQMLRERVMFAFPICQECIKNERYTPSMVVDHVTPHFGNPKLFWDSDNLQALCKRHHDIKTTTVDGGFGNKKK